MTQSETPDNAPDSSTMEVFLNLAMELHYAVAPQLDQAAILKKVQASLPESIIVTEGANGFSIAHVGLPSPAKEETKVIQTYISQAKEGSAAEIPLSVLQQTFDWPDARNAIGQSRSRVVLAELFGRVVGPPQRVSAFNAVLRAVLETAPPVAIYSIHAQRLVDPALLLARMKSSHPAAPIMAHVNVRFHILANEPSEIIMDTLGLCTLDLPDVQCHFRQIDPNKMAPFLFSTAGYIFDKGPIIETGQSIQGLTADQKWKCTMERLLLPPHRPVVDLNPGSPFVAGQRHG